MANKTTTSALPCEGGTTGFMQPMPVPSFDFESIVEMNILQVYPTFQTSKAGVQRYIEGLSKNLVRRGHKVKIATLERPRSAAISSSEQPLIVCRLSSIILDDFDVVHTHGFRVPFSSCSGILRKMSGGRVVMTVHTIFPKRSLIDKISKTAYDLTLGNATARTFNKFIAINSHISTTLLKMGVPSRKIVTIPNCIDLDRFKHLPSPDLFLEKAAVSPDLDIILVVGRLDWQKNLTAAVEVFARVNGDNPNTTLAIIGKDFGYKTRLLQLANELGMNSKVVFVGEVSEKILLSAYSCARVLLMTSVYEGFPTVLLEAMAMGLPVVSLSIRGVSNTVPSFNGVVWCKTLQEVSQAVSNVLSSDVMHEFLSDKAKATVQRSFSWERNVNKIIEAYVR